MSYSSKFQSSVPQAVPVAEPYGGQMNRTGSLGYNSPTQGVAPMEEFVESRTRDFLTKHDFPSGLQESMMKTTEKVARRYFIVDDSGSMGMNDGNRLIKTSSGYKTVKCTRWAELKAAIDFHAEFAYRAHAPTEFRLLNGAQPIVIGEDEDDGQGVRVLKAVMDDGPRGATPLCRHIREVARDVNRIANELRRRNQIVVVTVFTDGEASDGTLSRAMKELVNLPIWTVVRLCTDEEHVVDYWNNIDSNIELEMDVLDDLFGECEEVMGARNDWLTYGEALHRFREFGTPRKEMDNLDESLLSQDHMRSVLAMLLGGSMRDYPHIEVDPEELFNIIEKKLAREPLVYNPKRKRMTKWIDTKKLASRYGAKKCTIM